MINKAVKAMRKAATITLVVCAPMAMPGVVGVSVNSAAPAAQASGGEIAKPVAGLLIPARTRLIMDYKRVALA